MTTPFYLDAVSIISTFEAGGVKGLDAIALWAEHRGLKMIVTDMVIDELTKPHMNRPAPELASWIKSNTKTMATNEYKLYRQHVSDKANGIPNAYIEKDKGERAILELLDKLSPEERSKAAVFSEDKFFRNNVYYKDFSYGPSEILVQAASNKLISVDEYIELRDGFRSKNTYNPLKKKDGYSKPLDKFLDPFEIERFREEGKTAVSARSLKVITKGAAMLGGAAMVFDIGTSTVEAVQELNKGNQDEAARIMLKLGARLYASTQGALIGASLGAQGGLVFGLPGALLGAVVGAIGGGIAGSAIAEMTVDGLWTAAEKMLHLLRDHEYIKEPAFPNALPFISGETEYRRELAASGMPQGLVDRVVDSIKKGGEQVRNIQSLRDKVDGAKNQVGDESQYVRVTQYQIDDWDGVTIIESAREITKVYNYKVEITKYSESNQADPTWVYEEKWVRQETIEKGGRVAWRHMHFLRGDFSKEVMDAYLASPPEDRTPEEIAAIEQAAKDLQDRMQRGPHHSTASASTDTDPTDNDPTDNDPPDDGDWSYSDSPPDSSDAWVCVDYECSPAEPEDSWASPVVLDLDRNSVLDLVRFEKGNGEQREELAATFDFDGDGIPDRTAWVGPNDGFLVIDRGAGLAPGADGFIDQPQELAFTQWKTPQAWQAELDAQPAGSGIDRITDLSALRLLFDSNRDGVLDRNDEQWRGFRVWQDLNQDGVAGAGELRTLDQAGITAIGLVPDTSRAVRYADGSMITGTSYAQLDDGSQMRVGDVALRFESSAAARQKQDGMSGATGGCGVNCKLDNLVAAMAGFAPPAAGRLSLPPGLQHLPPGVIAAN